MVKKTSFFRLPGKLLPALAAVALGQFFFTAGSPEAREDAAMRVSVYEDPSGFEVDNGVFSFGLSRGPGATVTFVKKGELDLVSGNGEPLLAASLLESASLDRLVDRVSETTTREAVYEVLTQEHEHGPDFFRARLNGRLSFPGGDRLDFRLFISTRAGARHLSTTLELEPEGAFENRYIRDVRLRLPLSLEWRKRVAQGGDQGLEWDTRYYYEFTLRGGTILQDRNEWRYFAVEQESPESFHIWRSEGAGTSPLTHQHGIRAAGWTSVYDRRGGVLFGYRGMDERAPKSLWVKAGGGGEAQVLVYPHSQPAFSPVSDEVAGQVFGAAHEVDWVFYEGEHPEAWPDDYLAGLWGKEAPLSGSRPEHGFADLPGADIDLWDAPAAEGALRPIVSGGLPLARGEMMPGEGASVYSGGVSLPTQSRPLAYWPDGSVKWLHLLFPLAEAPGGRPPGGAAEPFEVSLRDGSRTPFALGRETDREADTVQGAVGVERRDGMVVMDNGLLRLELGDGENWLRQAYLDGRPLLREERDRPLAFVDFVRVEGTHPSGTAHIEGRADPGPVSIEEITIEEEGPLRAVVRLSGTAMSEEPTRVILRLKLYAGRGEMRLFHTVEFDFNDPRRAFLSSMGLRLPLRLDQAMATITAGSQAGPLSLEPGAAVSLRQFSPLHYRLLEMSGPGGGAVVVDSGMRNRGWMDVSGAGAGVQAVMRNMWQEYPKELTWRPESGDLEMHFWPAGARAMDVRRYSNFPHLAQGETASANNRWVLDSFYPADHVFVGIARTHEASFIFHDGSLSGVEKDTLAADIQSPPLVYAGYENYRQKGITFALPDYSRFPRVAAGLDNLVDFWLFHQRYWNWYGMWDYGDIQHRFRSGTYGQKLEAEKLIEALRAPEGEQPSRAELGARAANDFMAQQDWLFDNGRWGWTNTEGLPGLFLQNEYLRTGRRDVFFAAEAMARHSRDVVTRHSGRFFGAGTRHGVQHWSCGNHEIRQTVFTETRFHYYLSGESRSREVMKRLSEEVYLRRRARRDADHSALVYGLLTYWEMTGRPEIGELLGDYIAGFIVPGGIDLQADISITPDGVRLNSNDGPRVNCPGMFGHNFGAMHGLLEYYHLAGGERLREGMARMAHAIGSPGRLGWTSKIVVFGALHSEDPEPLKEAIDAWIDQRGYQTMFHPASFDPVHWTGETAFLSGSLPGSMMLANNLPYLLTYLDAEPELTGRHERDISRRESAERPTERRKPYFPRPSWQHEYDRPELEEFFAPWRPPESAPGAGSALEGSPGTIEDAFLRSDWSDLEVAGKRLPSVGWRFRTDPEGRGEEAGWHDPAHLDADWLESVPSEENWQDFLDRPYHGIAWYRRTFECPPEEGWKRAFLDFRAVDEEARVWLNGNLAGAHERGPAGWDMPFLVEVTDFIRPGTNHLAVRVRNTVGGGGIWQPVYLRLTSADGNS